LNEAVPDPASGKPESPLRVEDIQLIATAADGARRLAQAGYVLVCVSNQPAAAKGKVSMEELLAVHARVLALLAEEGVQIEASRLCFHHPDGVVEGLTGECDCRKPAPGMLVEAARCMSLDVGASWMVGDTDTDIEAGQAAGAHTALIEYPGSAHKREGKVRPTLRAPDLANAAGKILGEAGK
jgi:histidinol-phosphate phosphatase family protein